VLDNRGYGTERLLHPGDWKFNDIQPWEYHKLPQVLGGGTGYLVKTEGDFDRALNAAWRDRNGPSIIQVKIDEKDCSRALANLAARMSKTVVQK
jgi:indolepyruvate decarboxylase